MRTVFKIILIGLGGLMLLGGGICTATNALFLVSELGSRSTNGGMALYLVLGGISVAVASFGLFLIRVAGGEDDNNSHRRDFPDAGD